MKIQGTYTFNAPQQTVWNALQDPDILVTVLPGAQSIEEIGENEYASVMKVKVGPVGGTFKSTIKIENIAEPNSYTLAISSKGPLGQAKASGEVNLTAVDDAHTEIQYTGKANIGGRIASVGQRLIESTAKSVIGKALAQLDDTIQDTQASA